MTQIIDVVEGFLAEHPRINSAVRVAVTLIVLAVLKEIGINGLEDVTP